MCCHHMNRRDFLGLTTGIVAGAGLSSTSMLSAAEKATWAADEWDPDKRFLAAGKPLRIQPVGEEYKLNAPHQKKRREYQESSNRYLLMPISHYKCCHLPE